MFGFVGVEMWAENGGWWLRGGPSRCLPVWTSGRPHWQELTFCMRTLQIGKQGLVNSVLGTAVVMYWWPHVLLKCSMLQTRDVTCGPEMIVVCCWAAALPDPFPHETPSATWQDHGCRSNCVLHATRSGKILPWTEYQAYTYCQERQAVTYMSPGLIGSSTAMTYCSEVYRITCVWLLMGTFASPQPADAEPTWPFFP